MIGRYRGKRSLRRNGNPVATTPAPRWLETDMRRPSRSNAALTFGRTPGLAEKWCRHGANDRPTLLDEGNAHANNRKATQEVGGPVHGVDHPHAIGAATTETLQPGSHDQARLRGGPRWPHARPSDHVGDVISGS